MPIYRCHIFISTDCFIFLVVILFNCYSCQWFQLNCLYLSLSVSFFFHSKYYIHCNGLIFNTKNSWCLVIRQRCRKLSQLIIYILSFVQLKFFVESPVEFPLEFSLQPAWIKVRDCETFLYEFSLLFWYILVGMGSDPLFVSYYNPAGVYS